MKKIDSRSFPSPFEFYSFKEFLNKRISFLIENFGLTWGELSESLSLKSSGHIFLLVSGKRPISDVHLDKLSEVLRLSPKEKGFFKLLIEFDRAKSFSQEKKTLREKVYQNPEFRMKICRRLTSNTENKNNKLGPDYFEYFSSAEMITVKEVIGSDLEIRNVKDLLQFCKPWLKAPQAHKILKTLKSLGLIQEKDGQIILKSGHEKIEALEMDSLDQFHFSKEVNRRWFEIAEAGWDYLDQESFTSIGYTLAIPNSELKKLVEKSEGVLTDLAYEADALPGKKDQVIHMHILLNPLSKKGNEN